ncbi:hypothetical protein MVEN_01405400 [Mycena venus]|uniref:Uncharacterized protein n=1 Tax=Mycena venus TaxID=2733690 RepID=A0A8H7CVG4_9AGAR|nr:hypothetical protein MVEN_01405400 [Mycena venus]
MPRLSLSPHSGSFDVWPGYLPTISISDYVPGSVLVLRVNPGPNLTPLDTFSESRVSCHPLGSRGSVYFVTCLKNDNIRAFRRGAINGPQLLTRSVLKGGHSWRMQQRQGEYRNCDVGDIHTHVWIWRYLVERHYYCEHFFHLTTFRDGGVRAARVVYSTANSSLLLRLAALRILRPRWCGFQSQWGRLFRGVFFTFFSLLFILI